MIKATGLTLRRGIKVLLDQTDFVINPRERIGIVGKNGAGKSTLFSLFKHELEADAGNLDIPAHWETSAVEQEFKASDQMAREFVIDGDVRLRSLQKQRAALAEHQGHEIAELETALQDAGIWTAASRAEKLLAGLGFKPEQWEQATDSFSGGWQMRIALAKALMAPSDLLLLDEPTNHLDLDAMLWLERWLASYDGTVIIISHDTEFLNAVSTAVLHFDHQKIVRYKGNYDDFINQRAERMAQTQSLIERQGREMARMQSFIDRFKAKASKAKQAQSRVKALARMEKLAPLQAESGIDIYIPSPEQMPDPLLVLENVSTGYSNPEETTIIVKDINLMVRGGDRIGVLGVNGAGKSTLIKTIAHELEAIAGKVKSSKGLSIGYFAQQQLDMLDLQATPLQHLARIAPNAREQELRNYLGRFGFNGDMVNSLVEPFSGGEKARLALSLIVWLKPNMLLLDEPSNHLDIDTREALTTALAEFDGSMLMVSHDRHLLRSTVDKFWIVADGAVKEFDGDLEDYREWLNARNLQERQLNNADKEPSLDRKEQRRLDAQERQRIAALRKPLEKKLAEVEKSIDKVQKRIAEIDILISDENFYSEDNREKRIKALNEHGQLSQQNSTLEEQWLQLHEDIEALQ